MLSTRTGCAESSAVPHQGTHAARDRRSPHCMRHAAAGTGKRHEQRPFACCTDAWVVLVCREPRPARQTSGLTSPTGVCAYGTHKAVPPLKPPNSRGGACVLQTSTAPSMHSPYAYTNREEHNKSRHQPRRTGCAMRSAQGQHTGSSLTQRCAVHSINTGAAAAW